jgi:ABC-type microcin C transport system permease subunit YejB
MLAYIVKRVLLMVPTLFGILLLVLSFADSMRHRRRLAQQA